MLKQVKHLHKAGFALLRLYPRSKKPVGIGWQNGPRKSWAILREEFKNEGNVGVRLGESSKLTSGFYLSAIDCDVKSSSEKSRKEMERALSTLNLPLDHAPTVISGRGNGSRHIYVATEKPLKAQRLAKSTRRVKCLMPGEKGKAHSKEEFELLTREERENGYRIRAAWEISLMGTGQQTVLPPSVHPDSGRRYTWAVPFSLEGLPTFIPPLRDLVRNLKDAGAAEAFKPEAVNLYNSGLKPSLIKAIETGEGVEDRSATLFTVALTMCRLGFSDNEILSLLSDRDNFLGQTAYDHTKSRSRTRAVKWLDRFTLRKARFETDIMRRFEDKPHRMGQRR